MSLTAQTIALDCLSYIGEFALDAFTSFQDARAAILARIARDINAAQQEIYRARPDLFRDRIGVTVPAPETQNVTLTSGSTAITFGTAFANNLDGATCNIGGCWNTVRASGETFCLVNPYLGASGVAAMTVYGDAILLDTATAARIIGNVEREGRIPLRPLANRQAFLHFEHGHGWDYGLGFLTLPIVRCPGLPRAWWAEPCLSSTGLKIRLLLTPLPDRQLPLEFDVERRPALITVANFGTDEADPGVGFTLPAQMDETLLLPLVRARWSMSPWFKDADQREALAADAQAARVMLGNFRAQGQSGATFTTVGYGF